MVAERPLYFDYQGSADLWLCIQKPGPSDAYGTITYFTPTGWLKQKTFCVSGNERLTIKVNDEIDENLDLSVTVSSDTPIIVERPMYFDFNIWTGGHNVVGVPL